MEKYHVSLSRQNFIKHLAYRVRPTYKSSTRSDKYQVSHRNSYFSWWWAHSRPKHVCFSFLWRCCPTRAMASSFLRFLDHTQRRTTVGRTPLDEWSARRRDLYLTTRNTHNRQISMPSVGFEPTISASERPQTYALDRAATGTGFPETCRENKHTKKNCAPSGLYLQDCIIFCLVTSKNLGKLQYK